MEQLLSMQIRWSDLDPNFHVRHSVYYDWCASLRLDFLSGHGLTAALMQELKVGFILFREECQFKREIRSNDQITVSIELLNARRDFSRVAVQHRIFKNGDSLAALLTVEGAWMDTEKRKLTTPPEIIYKVFEKIPLAKEFSWQE